jgi:hypothetical protein
MHTTDSTQEFFQGFALPVLRHFNAQIGFCRFEQGDVIYNTPKGYEKWDEAQKHLKFIIQVKQPNHGMGMASDEAGVFEENWKSDVVFEVTFPATGEKKKFTTTQGRLYTFLWRGDWAVFDDLKPLPCPLTCFTLLDSAPTVAYEVKRRVAGQMQKPNLFIIPYDPTHSVSAAKYEAVRKRLKEEFIVVDQIFRPDELGMGHVSIVPTVGYACFAIDLGASSKISDALKEVLYKPSKNKKTTKESFRLSAHGHFIPWNVPREGDVVTVSFAHGHTFYRYRLAKPRLSVARPELREFLMSMLVDCPNYLFHDPPTCSGQKLCLPIELTRVRTHELMDHAGNSLGQKKYKAAHDRVEVELIEHDPNTLAVEVPVWASWDELGDCCNHVTPPGTLTGHIDVLRCVDGKIEIWDFKPNAFTEITAACQVLLYAQMLSIRTGIPLSEFKCGYFDYSDVFTFNPEKAHETAFIVGKNVSI